jgi:hypothetical protein
LTINKADATVTANSDTSLVYNGAVQSVNGFTATGLVDGETTLVLAGVTAGASGTNAGTYAITASGTDSNYNLTFVDGSLVIAKAALTATATAPNKVYDGNAHAATVLIITAGLVGNESLGVTSTGSFNSKDVLTANTVTIASASLANGSHGGLASNYSLAGGQTVAASITPKQVTLAGSAGLVKTYDGHAALPSGSLGHGSVSGLLDGEVVGVVGAPVFDSADAGARTLLQGTVALTGDASPNYSLAWTTGSGNITPRDLVVSGITVDDKVYDGNTAASVNTSSALLAGLVNGDVLNISASGQFVDKNVAADKTVTLTSSYSGDDASNYRIVSQGSTTASITRLTQVTWTGGSSGNWFDPANWAGGAVPDLANVSEVVIPAGVTVTFGDTLVAPAERGPVQIDRLGALGNLDMTAGTLNIGAGGVALAQFVQSGGALSNEGDMRIGSLLQSGGSMTVDGALAVTEDFEQGRDGSIAVRGAVDITDTRGGLILGNLVSGGPLTLRSQDGDIRQAPGTTLVAQDSASISARTANGQAADVVLAEAANDFRGRVDLDARNAELVDRNGLVLGVSTLTGDLRLTSTGALGLGQTSVGGRLLVDSNGGDVTQSGALVVNGGIDINAGAGGISLTHQGNRLGGQVQLAADGGVTVLGVTSTGGGAAENMAASTAASTAVRAATNAATQALTLVGTARGGAMGASSASGTVFGGMAIAGKTQPLSVSLGEVPETGERVGQVRFMLNDTAGQGLEYEAELVGSTLRIRALSANSASAVARDLVIEAALQALESQLVVPRSRVSVAYLAL